MTGNTLPRPARPSIAPPTGPLPSLPVPKQRTSNASPSGIRTPSSGLPSPAARAVSHSVSPYRPSTKHAVSPSVPTIAAEHTTGVALPAGKSLRKTVSIGAFPQPPKHGVRSPSSPLATRPTINGDSVDQRLTPGVKGSIPSRGSSLKKPRTSNMGGARVLSKSPLCPPSFLNGNGSAESVAVDTSHLNLPSPPQSRNSSPNGSRSTSATTIEDRDDETRGRTNNKVDKEPTSKDGKGNVVVSVRVRPDAGPKDGQQENLWEVNNKNALISYQGKEGGDYFYGKHAQWRTSKVRQTH